MKLDIKKTIIFISIALIICLGVNTLKNKKYNYALELINQKSDYTRYVYPLGKVVGLKAKTDGALVVGYEEDDVEYIGSLKIGDNIVKVDNQKIENSQDLYNILQNIKKDKAYITFERNNKYTTEPVKLKREDGKVKLGLWVRDKISGVGTMTFYDPSNFKFKAIGHAITDTDTNVLLNIKQGYLYNPSSIEIIKSSDNEVGKINGEFSSENPIGEFTYNTNFGISGTLLGEKNNYLQLMEVGNSKDINLGKASILFEDKDRNIVSYDIEIKEILDKNLSDRDMLIEVIDLNLLNYTGGIVQGMSGCPIIQDNKIIGAITHVFKDNPKKGYGIFIEEMIELDKRY